MSQPTRIFAIGDVAVNREQPDTIFELVHEQIRKADFAFAQIEAIYAKSGEVNVSGTSSPLRGDPENVNAIGRAGFNLASFASNHCMDYGISAFRETLQHFRNVPGMHVFGAGENLAEARKPVIVEHNGNRIGFLAYCSILPIRYWADVDRPGCAPARARTIYETLEPDQPGTPPRILTYPHDEDLANMLADIRALKAQVDVVVVSQHWGLHFKEGELATYETKYAKHCIDAGADVILGHHQHILKPVEIYKGKPIFYGLANFAFDMYYQPGELDKPERIERRQRLHPGWTHDPAYPTFPFPVDSRKGMAVFLEVTGGEVSKVRWQPTMINQKSQPRLLKASEPEFGEVLAYMRKITAAQKIGTQFEVDGDTIVSVDAAAPRAATRPATSEAVAA
ncbi:CapA family protein [Ramlibacter sp.]|uniref:CapA family protein n=1 Tax=Ramlibacter sp. TaxID=1917967 RepID=UPI003D14B693